MAKCQKPPLHLLLQLQKRTRNIFPHPITRIQGGREGWHCGKYDCTHSRVVLQHDLQLHHRFIILLHPLQQKPSHRTPLSTEEGTARQGPAGPTGAKDALPTNTQQYTAGTGSQHVQLQEELLLDQNRRHWEKEPTEPNLRPKELPPWEFLHHPRTQRSIQQTFG